MDNFSMIYKILSVLEKSMDLEELDTERISAENLRVSPERWNKYTLKGLEYLSENTIMQRMYKVAKGITDLIP